MIDVGTVSRYTTVRRRMGVALLATLTAGLTACTSTPPAPGGSPTGPSTSNGPVTPETPIENAETVAKAYLADWSAGRTAQAARRTTSPQEASRALAGLRKSLQLTAVNTAPGEVSEDGDSVTLPFTAKMSVRELGDWSYEGTVPMTRTDKGWRVAWSPAVVHPQLTDGAKLELDRPKPAPVTVVDRDGAKLPTTGAGAEAAFKAAAAAPQGSPGGTIRLVRPGGKAALHTFEPKTAPGPVRTTIDAKVQKAAERALADIDGKAASIVAIDSRTGEIRAVANRDANGGSSRNRAFLNRQPPGSTFKVITAYAAMRNGTSINDVVPCPEKTSVGGRMVGNFRGFKLGDVKFRVDFAKSCNTAMLDQAMAMPHGLMTSSAKQLGFFREHNTGIPSFDGSLAETGSKVDRAYASIGQGSVQANALSMATVAATVASGSYRSPVLLESAAKSAGEPLPKAYAGDLKTLMREAARGGSAWKHLSFAGGDIGAKTGTAEFASSQEPGTHAWLIGFRNDLAFAVMVENGGVGGSAAGPVAADFFRGLR